MTKAWTVRDSYEENAFIVFHHHGLAARRLGAEKHCDDFEGVKIERSPEFDQYAEMGYVPPKVLIENGWWFECVWCSLRVDEEIDYNEDENGNNLGLSLVGVIEHGQESVYCCQSCKDSHQKAKDDGNKLFEEWKAKVIKAYHFLEFTKWSGGYPRITFTAEFTFPGAQYGGSIRWESDKPDEQPAIFVSGGDVEAWEIFYKTVKQPA